MFYGLFIQEPDATREKRIREFGKYPQQSQFGFRIVGMRFYSPKHPDADEKGFRCFQKSYGRSLTAIDQIEEAFRLYFSAGIEFENDTTSIKLGDNGEEMNGANVNVNLSTDTASTPMHSQRPTIRARSISNLLVNLRPLIRLFEENKSIHFYASSLLIVYEGDASIDSDLTFIKMIDFGRVRREAGCDYGYIHGLNTLKSIFTKLLEEEKRF